MTIDEFIKTSCNELTNVGIESARLDCLILLEDELNQDRSSLIAHLDKELSKSQTRNLQNKIIERTKHIPISYIRAKSEFYGRQFNVNKYVLIPRPESEDIIEAFGNFVYPNYLEADHVRVADIGTGSGCIGITLSLEFGKTIVDLYDKFKYPLEVAASNIKMLNVDINNIYNENLLSNANKRAYDVIVANLPYVPEIMEINSEAKFEPKSSIFAGTDGLCLYNKFFIQVKNLLYPPKFIIIESMPAQHKALAQYAKNSSYELYRTRNFVQLFKFNSSP